MSARQHSAANVAARARYCEAVPQMAPTGDALTVVVAFGVGSGVCVYAAAVRDGQGAGVGSLSYFTTPVVAGRRDGCGVAAVYTRLARANALCPLAMCRVALSADLLGSRSATGV